MKTTLFLIPILLVALPALAIDCSTYSGDFVQKMNSCAAALPSTGGILDGSRIPSDSFSVTSGTWQITTDNVIVFLPPTGTSAITSSSNPVIQVKANNVNVQGFGNSTDAVTQTGTTFKATATNQMLWIGDGTLNIRGFHIDGVRFDGASTSTGGIVVKGNPGTLGYSRFERLELLNYSGSCIDLTSGGHSQLSFEHIRCKNATGVGFNQVTSNADGQISIRDSLVTGTTGSPGYGYDLGNAAISLDAVEAESNVIGMHVSSGTISAHNLSFENNTQVGMYSSMSPGSLMIQGFFANHEVLPVKVDGSNSSTVLISPLTNATVGSYSVSVVTYTGVTYTGDNVIVGCSSLDKPTIVSTNPPGILRKLGCS